MQQPLAAHEFARMQLLRLHMWSQEVLVAASSRYHELLTAAAAASIARALESDSLTAELAVRSESAARELCVEFGLPCQFDGAVDGVGGVPAWGRAKQPNNPTQSLPTTTQLGSQSKSTAVGAVGAVGTKTSGGGGSRGVPPTPFTAPFTALVPALLRVVRGFVADSAAYLRGLVPPWELHVALLQPRDRMVSKVSRKSACRAHNVDTTLLPSDGYARKKGGEIRVKPKNRMVSKVGGF